MIPKELLNQKPLQPGERLGANRASEYMGAEDIDPGAEPVLTIKAIFNAVITLQKGKEAHDIIVFAEETVPGIRTVRPLVVNATNRKTLRKLFGSVLVENLVGKSIQLYLDHNVRDPSDGSRTDGIRIRNRKVSPKQEQKFICADCGCEIVGIGRFSPEAIAKGTKQRYGIVLCSACGKKRGEAAQAAQSTQAENPAQPEGPALDAEDSTDHIDTNKEV